MTKREQSVYASEAMLAELRTEAEQLDRSSSWIVQRCVKVGMAEVRRTEVPPRSGSREE